MSMHAAQITAPGQSPIYTTTPQPPPPTDPEVVQIKVSAVGLHQTVRSRASGTHYSSSSGPSSSLPYTPGIDGVGTTPSGQTVFFSRQATAGTMAEVINVPVSATWPVPEGVDPVLVAGYLNAALSSWMALKHRVADLKPGFAVVIMGVGSTSGRVAVQIARHLGARRIIGVGRNRERMGGLGLDEMVELREKVEETDFEAIVEVDVVLDYVYGTAAEWLLRSLAARKASRPVQYVHIGSLGGTEMNLPGSVLRCMDLTVRGSGSGAWRMRDASKEVPGLLEAFRGGEREMWKVKRVQLSDVESVWAEKEEGQGRLVFMME